MLQAKLTVGVFPPKSEILGVQPKLNKAAYIKLISNVKYGTFQITSIADLINNLL